MKGALLCCASFLMVALLGAPVQALEPLVPYDNFNAKRLDPAKWFGTEVGGGGYEAVREVRDHRLHLASRVYVNINRFRPSWIERGRRLSLQNFDSLRLNALTSAAVTAIEATVRVKKVEVTECSIPTVIVGADLTSVAQVWGTSLTSVTQARAGLFGFFFNTATPTPGSAVNDVLAGIAIVRQAPSTDTEKILRVQAFVLHCTDASCIGGTQLDLQDMGPIKRGKKARLRIQWDHANHRFIFQRDGEPEVFSPYTVSDTAPSGSQVKFLGTANTVPFCRLQAGRPRPASFIDAFFDDVLVNESATDVFVDLSGANFP